VFIVGIVGVAVGNILAVILILIFEHVFSLEDVETEGVFAQAVAVAFRFDMLKLLFKCYL
jgi:hypothetical protein